ncbi:Helicase associated domain protein [Flavobacterium sp.]|uniref:Helicase associated domain protein n=1 Tax=Flavobacterium sp. TaxID=239 RepID=UPI0037513ABE
MALYQHNQLAYDRLVESLKINQKACIVQPTGTGKSFIVAELLKDNPALNFLIISSSSYIKNQFTESFPEINNFRFETYSYLISNSFISLLNNSYDYIVLDEFHRAGAPLWNLKLNELLNNYPTSKIVGLTATHIRYMEEDRDLIDELFDGNLVHHLTIYEAFDTGILPRPKYITTLISLDSEYEKLKNNILKSNSTNKPLLLKNILESKLYFENSLGVDKILKKHITTERNFILFFASIEELKNSIHIFEDAFKSLGNVNVFEIYSGLAVAQENFLNFKRNSILEDGSFNLLLSVEQLNEGLHLSNIDGVLFVRPTKSHIIYNQQLGRCLSSKGKQPIVFDLVNNFKNKSIHFKDKREFIKTIPANYLKEDYSKHVYSFSVIDELKDVMQIFDEFNPNNWNDKLELLQTFYIKFNRLPKDREVFKNVNIGLWLRLQKASFNKEKLSQFRIDDLLKISKDIFIDLDDVWNDKLELLQTFYNQFNRLPKNREVFENVNIGSWFSIQKKIFSKGNLSQTRIDDLLKISKDIFIGFDDVWNDKLELLQTFYIKFNRLPVQLEKFENVNIGSWFSAQKLNFNKEKLNQTRIDDLLKISKDIFK